jgi:hypothetical protein
MGGVSLQSQARLCSGANPQSAPYSSRSRRSADPSALPSAVSDINIARTTGTNVLVVGPDRLLGNVLSMVAPDANHEAIECQGGKLQLPPTASRPPTVIVHDVDVLAPADQCRLLDWLDIANGRTKVVSTSSVSLLPLVESRTFNDTLYYRLNTIYIDLSDQ